MKEATIELTGEKSFKVVAKNVSDKNKYIQSAKLNGENYSKTFIKQSDIDEGGTLEFNMGSKPNKKWGTREKDRPSN